MFKTNVLKSLFVVGAALSPMSFLALTSCKASSVKQSISHVTNFSELKSCVESQARQGVFDTKTVIIDQDVVCNETIYVMNNTTIVCNENHSITRANNFLDDLFVVGEDENGNNPIVTGDKAVLTLKTNSDDAILTIDGNKDNISNEIYGSAIFISNCSQVNLNKNVEIQNFRKDRNVRALTKRSSQPVKAGGAGVMITSGTFNMYGGLIDNCICPAEDGSEDKAYMGGAIFNDGGFNMYGGTVSNCSAARGGALYNYSMAYLITGTISNCNATKYGGAVYLPDSQYSNLILGSASSSENKINITNNTSAASGGGIFGIHHSVIYSLGNCLFEGNTAANNGGAISSTGSIILDNTTLKQNKAIGSTSKGGAIYAYTNSASLASRETQLNNCSFDSNTSVYSGGAITFDSGDDTYPGATGKINNCVFSSNSSAKGGAICAQERSNVKINGSTFNENSATGTGGGAIYATSESNTIIDSVSATKNTATKGGFAYVTTTNTVFCIKSGSALENVSTATSPSGSTLWCNSAASFVKIKGKISKQYFNFDGDVSGVAGFEVYDYEE